MPARPIAVRAGGREKGREKEIKNSSTEAVEEFLSRRNKLAVRGAYGMGVFIIENVRIKFIREELRAFHDLRVRSARAAMIESFVWTRSF